MTKRRIRVWGKQKDAIELEKLAQALIRAAQAKAAATSDQAVEVPRER